MQLQFGLLNAFRMATIFAFTTHPVSELIPFIPG